MGSCGLVGRDLDLSVYQLENNITDDYTVGEMFSIWLVSSLGI